MRKIDRLNKKIIEGEMIWKKCNDFIKSLTNPKILIDLKKIAKTINKSKNTAKLYIRLAVKSKWELMKYYCISSSKDNAFPFKLSEMITEQYRLECLKKNNKKKEN